MTKTRPVGPNLLRLLPVAAVLLVMSCGTNPAGPAASIQTATVYGVLKAVPACPADRIAHACNPHPLTDVTVQADSAGARVISSSVTGADGRYSLRVEPGRYVLRAPTSLRCRSVPVTVSPGTTTRADLTCAVNLVPVPPNSA